MDFLYSEWLQALEQDGAVAVATVVNGIGAMPRENGAQMLMKKSGKIFETVGGGKLEAGVMECAKNVLVDKQSEMFHFDLTGSDVSKMDMICGGEGDVFIYYSDKKDIKTLQEIISLQNADGWMYFPIATNGGISYITEDGALIGDKDETKKVSTIDKNKDIYIGTVQDNKYLTQWIEMSGKLHIMGGGHVSLDIARVAKIAGIECCIYDDRAEFLTQERFPFASRIVLDDMRKLPDVAINKKDMIAIVTRGHMYDKECLQWALSKDVGYVGMIGSKRKTKMIFDSLIDEGCSKESIDQVYAPIGLEIGALTPAEIAVAIVAEIIQFKRQ